MQRGDLIAGRFEVERFVARGGMAEVYRARDRVSGKPVAIKIVTLDEVMSEERVAQEARALAELRHPAIVRYVTHDRDPRCGLFLAMEWLHGISLAERLKQGALSIEEALDLVARIADGLAVAHAAGMVHRDIKPLNIFLVNESLERVKILDFGIVRIGDLAPITAPGLGMGTPHYMAPEQARGERNIGPQADVFALGGVLYRCVTGRSAYGGKQLEAILAKIAMATEAPRVSEVLERVPPELDDLVANLMAAEPARRPPDAAAAAAYIRAVRRALTMGHDATLELELETTTLTEREIQPVAVIFADLELEEADTLPSPAAVDVKKLAAAVDARKRTTAVDARKLAAASARELDSLNDSR